MSQKTDLKLLERKIYTRYFDDGIFDMLLGYYLFWGGLFQMLSSRIESDAAKIIIMFLGFVLIYPAFVLAKRKITIARLGQVEFGQARTKKRTRLIIFMVIMVMATAALVILTASRGSTADADLLIPRGSPVGPIFVGSFVALIFLGIALFMDYDRMFIWAAIFGMAYMMGMLLSTSLPHLIGGGLIIVVGAVYLSKFLKRYPRIDSEHLDVS